MSAWVIGNWKQNPATIEQAQALTKAIVAASEAAALTHCQLMVIPSQIHLTKVADEAAGTLLQLGCQDVSAHSATTGAYTGDCSASQMQDAGARWTLVGHSERRQYHQENGDILGQKITQAISQQLGVIYCIGETQSQYQAGQTLTVLSEQLQVIEKLLAEGVLSADASTRLLVAYEPVWAIGTGKVPTIEEVSATHAYIKQVLGSYSASLATVKVLYGGSVNAENAHQFALAAEVDGALVGGASLKADSFLAIAEAFERAAV